jgi:hypothetical protein
LVYQHIATLPFPFEKMKKERNETKKEKRKKEEEWKAVET